MSKLLIIEDERFCREDLTAKLSPFFEVDPVASFVAAMERMQATCFDAVLLDIGLPDCSRDTVVDRIKARQPSSALVIISGYADPDYIREAILKNASNYLIKGKDDQDGESLASAIRVAIISNTNLRKLQDASRIAMNGGGN